jgi:hypothetical protein
LRKSWNSSLNTCVSCIVTALSALPPGEASGLFPDILPDKVYTDITNYCRHVPNTDFAGEWSAEAALYEPGWLTSGDYQSQILLYNMTVWLANSTLPGFVGGGGGGFE